MRNIFLTITATVMLCIGVASCAALEDFFGEGTVFTTQDQLQEGEEAAIIPWDQLPNAIKDQIPEGTALVMANKDQLIDNAAYVPAGGELDGDAIGGMIDTGFNIAKTFLPSLAAWEGIVTIFSKRKRKHYVKAAKSLVPTDKTMDLGGTLASVGAALGIAHSSETSAAAFEADGEESEWEEA